MTEAQDFPPSVDAGSLWTSSAIAISCFGAPRVIYLATIVANMMRLTKLPDEVKALIASGQLSAGHARALIGVPDPAAAAKQIVAEDLNVRQTEALAEAEGVPERKPQKPRDAKAKSKDADTVALEKRISDALGLKVSVAHRDPGGSVQIRYRDLDQLDEVLRRLEAAS